MPLYTAFGLTLAADRAVPGLSARATPAPVDTHIWFDAPPDPRVRALSEEEWFVTRDVSAGEPALRASRLGAGSHFRLRYADDTQFVVDAAGRNVWATWSSTSTLADTATYLLGPVIGFVLRLRGVSCLHASAVALDDRAVVFVGAACAGKSTTAAAFVRIGHRALADDIVALSIRDDAAYAVPAYPQLRLWPESVALLYGSTSALPQLTPTWDKRALDLVPDDGFQGEPSPIAAVYILERRSPDTSPYIETLCGRERLMLLLANGYVSYLMERAQRRQEFDTLSRLVTHVPVRRLVVPSTVTNAARYVAELRDTLLEDCEASRCTALPTTAQ